MVMDNNVFNKNHRDEREKFAHNWYHIDSSRHGQMHLFGVCLVFGRLFFTDPTQRVQRLGWQLKSTT